MIVLFTDFGLEGPYSGQLEAVLQQQAPGVPVIRLFSDLPAFDIQAAAYLLPAYAGGFPPGTVFLCVVDPGVGGERPGVLLEADGRWYVGADEGLFELLARRARTLTYRHLPPARGVSNSFHGRDVFAPVAARLARSGKPDAGAVVAQRCARSGWPDELFQVVYIDHFGNAISGVRATALQADAGLEINGHVLRAARTFSDVPGGEAFWYPNSSGLVEIAVNRGRASEVLGARTGMPIIPRDPTG
jgi:S-adenosylmethionine hydrolase